MYGQCHRNTDQAGTGGRGMQRQGGEGQEQASQASAADAASITPDASPPVLTFAATVYRSAYQIHMILHVGSCAANFLLLQTLVWYGASREGIMMTFATSIVHASLLMHRVYLHLWEPNAEVAQRAGAAVYVTSYCAIGVIAVCFRAALESDAAHPGRLPCTNVT